MVTRDRSMPWDMFSKVSAWYIYYISYYSESFLRNFASTDERSRCMLFTGG